MDRPIRDPAPPPGKMASTLKPTITTVNQTSTAVKHSIEGVAATSTDMMPGNASAQIARAAAKHAKARSDASLGSALLNGSHTTGINSTATMPSAAPQFTEDLEKVSTASFAERVSHFPLAHFFGWILLFVALTVATVVLLNWCLRSRQNAADAHGDDSEEMHQRSSMTGHGLVRGASSEGFGSATSSSRLLSSRGNLARQQFLESRRSGANGVKDYGGAASSASAK